MSGLTIGTRGGGCGIWSLRYGRFWLIGDMGGFVGYLRRLNEHHVQLEWFLGKGC
ncbi:MAG: hypothetical protein OEY77_04660 [Nitrospira sp.]|nr:hypothetical protein [Nitrospira sp.]